MARPAHAGNMFGICVVKFAKLSWKDFSVEISDTPQGAHGGTGTAPLAEPPVFPRAEEVLPAAVVGVLMKDPVTLHNISRGDIPIVEALT